MIEGEDRRRRAMRRDVSIARRARALTAPVADKLAVWQMYLVRIEARRERDGNWAAEEAQALLGAARQVRAELDAAMAACDEEVAQASQVRDIGRALDGFVSRLTTLIAS